jgi:type II secretory pathway component PulK
MTVMKQRAISEQSGLALIMVIVMIAITSALLMSLTDSTYVSMRLNRAAEQRSKAEYILKSAINLAAIMIKIDSNETDDRRTDLWMRFEQGTDVPAEWLGITEPNVRVSLLISSEKGKIPIKSIVRGDQADPFWSAALVALFEVLEFDNGPLSSANSEDGPRQLPSSKQLAASVIDYLDEGSDSYSDGDMQGIEGDLPPTEEFRNDGRIDSLASELGSIPGFSAARIQALLPFVSERTTGQVNINLANEMVLRALVRAAGSDLNDADEVSKIIQCRDPVTGGAFTSNIQSQLRTCGVDERVINLASTGKIGSKGDVFYVISKVEFGNASKFMASAFILKTAGGRMPTIDTLLLY